VGNGRRTADEKRIGIFHPGWGIHESRIVETDELIAVAVEVREHVIEVGVLQIAAGEAHLGGDEIDLPLRQSLFCSLQNVQVVAFGVGLQPVYLLNAVFQHELIEGFHLDQFRLLVGTVGGAGDNGASLVILRPHDLYVSFAFAESHVERANMRKMAYLRLKDLKGGADRLE